MHHDSQSRVRGSRLPLRFEVLEDRTQPNDMLGLGMSLLGGWNMMDFGAATQPEQVVRQETTDTGLVLADISQGDPSFLSAVRADEQAEFGTIPAAVETVSVSQTGVDQAFASVNAQSADPSLARQRHLNDLINQARQSAQSTAQGVVAPLPGGKTSTASTGGSTSGPGAAGPGLTLTSGTTSVSIDSHGRFGVAIPGIPPGGFQVGGSGNVFEHFDYYGMATGPVRQINPTNCPTVVVPIQLFNPADPSVAISQVDCGGGVQFLFIQIASGALLQGGLISVSIPVGSTLPDCYYGYTDYDVTLDTNNNGTYIPNPGFDYFTVFNNADSPAKHFWFGDATAPSASHWQQQQWAGLRTTLNGASNCQPLTNGPPTLTPNDWTGAFRWVPTSAGIIYVHLRED